MKWSVKVHQRSDLGLSNTFINFPVASLWLTAQTQLSYADAGNSLHPGHTGFTLLHKLTMPEYQLWCSVESLICSHMAPSMSSTNRSPWTRVIQLTHVQQVSNVLDMLELLHILSLFIYAKQLLPQGNRSWQQPYPGRGEARVESTSCEREVGDM